MSRFALLRTSDPLLLCNYSKRRRAKCKLREQLRPLDNATQRGHAEALLGHYYGIPWIHSQLFKCIAPNPVRSLPAHHRAVRADDEHVLLVRIAVRSTGQVQI